VRQYETGFILSPSLSEEETEQFINQMAEIVDQKKGRMIKQDIWGKRRLSYPIKKFQEGFYVFFQYEGEGDVSQELERRFKQTDAVIRFMTVKRDPKDLLPRKKKRHEADAGQGSSVEKSEARPDEAAPASGTEEE
jgi:small subunit ribosomal protein S6